jgi:hypothetical protein
MSSVRYKVLSGKQTTTHTTSSAEVKERVDIHLYSPLLGPRGLFQGELYL